MGKRKDDIIDAEYEEVDGPARPFYQRGPFRIAVATVAGAVLLGVGGFVVMTQLNAPKPGAQSVNVAALSAPGTLEAPAGEAFQDHAARALSQTAAVAPTAQPTTLVLSPAALLSDRRGAALAVVTPDRPREQSPAVFRDCDDVCPDLVAIPSGNFLMGSPANEVGRAADEGPQHRVNVETFAVARYETTVHEWMAFVEATHRPAPPADCFTTRSGAWTRDGSWTAPGFAQTGAHPVTCVTLADARAYAAWLSARTGRVYRLPTEAEWEYAARANTQTPYWQDASAIANVANFGSKGAQGTMPVGHFPPNGFGLFDMAGNVWEMSDTCFASDYSASPPVTDDGQCADQVIRGGGWGADAAALRSAQRNAVAPQVRFSMVGFRVARSIPHP